MNLFALAIRNIKLNSNKYIMYIFSMSFSVFTAYTFLALMQNKYVMLAFQYDKRYQVILLSFGIIIMVFVLFFLISSNNSFIRARKKEISTYSLFGMTNGMIGKLLFLETLIVGLATLIIGICTGVFFSKLVAMFLVNISLSNFVGDISFSIHPLSICITALIFMVIFCLMGLSGLRVINKFELIDLFKAEKVSEGKVKGSFLLLILSLIFISAGYYLASYDEPYVVILGAIPILILVITGTYLFFWGGLPKVLDIVRRNKISYYKGANLISISAFSHRMKSIASVMATIAVLSAVASTAIATGFTLYSNAEKNTYNNTGYDMFYYGGEDSLLNNVHEAFNRNDIKITYENTFELYETQPEINTVMVDNNVHFNEDKDYFRIYSQSDYNKLISNSKSDLKIVEIMPGEGLYIYPFSTDDIESAMTGVELTFSNSKMEITSAIRSAIPAFGAMHTLVLCDADFKNLMQNGDVVSAADIGDTYNKATVINYNNALELTKINQELDRILLGKTQGYHTAFSLYNESLETFGLICFIGFFMSGIFILMTASLLYFKQVMAAEEERHQYRMLRKIGLDYQMEKQVVKRRLIPVFLIPLVLGIIHSIFAMKTADTIVFSNIIPVENSYLSVLGFSAVMYAAYAIVYGIFYLITKEQYTRMIRL